jgi:hypothetical protein
MPKVSSTPLDHRAFTWSVHPPRAPLGYAQSVHPIGHRTFTWCDHPSRALSGTCPKSPHNWALPGIKCPPHCCSLPGMYLECAPTLGTVGDMPEVSTPLSHRWAFTWSVQPPWAPLGVCLKCPPHWIASHLAGVSTHLEHRRAGYARNNVHPIGHRRAFSWCVHPPRAPPGICPKCPPYRLALEILPKCPPNWALPHISMKCLPTNGDIPKVSTPLGTARRLPGVSTRLGHCWGHAQSAHPIGHHRAFSWCVHPSRAPQGICPKCPPHWAPPVI